MNTYKSKIRDAQLGAAVGCNDLSAVYTVDAANNAEVSSKSGHGIMAERALTLADKFCGRDSQNVGVDNAKDGADRLVDGIALQTKFYSSGKGCVDACFASKSDGGMYRYMNPDGTPMPVEVPKDMYDDAVSRFAQKIADGKVEGVTDAADADKYVKASLLTYENAQNLCKPLTAESLLYDAATGVVHCSFAFGISAAAVFVVSLSEKKGTKYALIKAICAGVKVFGLSYICHMLMSQFARSAVFISLLNFTGIPYAAEHSRAVLTTVQAVNSGLSVVMGGATVSAKAAAGQLAKITCAGFLMNLIVFAVFLIPDIFGLCTHRITLRKFGSRAAAMLCARIAASFALINVSLLLNVLSLPSFVSIAFCITAACLGGIYGRRFVYGLFK